MTIAAYMRVSSDEQRKRHTIGTQREQLDRYASTATLTVAEWYADDAALVLFYAPAFSDQDRAAIMATRSDGITLSCCDMRRAGDVAFALYLRDELDCTRGIAPITISGQECARAGLSIAWGS